MNREREKKKKENKSKALKRSIKREKQKNGRNIKYKKIKR